MTPNDLAAEIYLAWVREKLVARSGDIEKIKERAMEEAALRACECSDRFWKALGAYAKAKGYVPMPEAQAGQVQGAPAVASAEPGAAASPGA